jgi:ankyrin repeat protein
MGCVQAGCTAAWTAADQQLLAAVKSSNAANVEAALAAGARPNISYADGLRPLTLAVIMNDVGSAETLLRHGANPDIVHQANTLEGLIRANYILTANLKVANLDPQSTEGVALLSLASDREMVEVLVRGGADVNLRNVTGETPLTAASRDGDVARVKILLDLGAEIDPVDLGGRTPLAHALLAGRTTVAAALLEAGADPNRPGLDGRTPLHNAALMPDGAAIPVLLRARADPNRRAADGNTPLILAARDGYLGAAEALLSGGADPNVGDNSGYTALDWAVAKGHEQVAARLREAGATASGGTPPQRKEMALRQETAAATNRLRVFTSSLLTDGRFLKIRGRLDNEYPEPVHGVRYRVAILLRDARRVLDSFIEERPSTVIPAGGSTAIRLDIESGYSGSEGRFIVEASPMRVGDHELPPPAHW